MDQALDAGGPNRAQGESIPGSAKRHWRRLGRAMHHGDLDKAEKLSIAYLRKHPQDSISWEVWSEVLRAREQRADEERILRRGVDFTGAPRLRFRLAQMLASSGDLDEAMAVLDAFTGDQLRSLLPGQKAVGVVPVES